MAKYCKYKKLAQEVSYDSGITWERTGVYVAGDLIEYHSLDCGYVPTYVFTWSGGTTAQTANIDSDASSYTYNVVSTLDGVNIGYNYQLVQFAPDWVNVTDDTDSSITFTVSENTTLSSRTATLTLTQSGSNNTITLVITQAERQSVGEYFTIVSLENSGSVTWYGNKMSYSVNGGSWSTPTSSVTINVSQGDLVKWKGTEEPTQQGIGYFRSTKTITASGNTMSLLYGDNFSGQTSLSGKNFAFFSLFYFCDKLTDASSLSLPATTLSDCCYQQLFWGCSSLTAAPTLPATTLTLQCYCDMFQGCSSLVTAPSLPATTLAQGCYYGMFDGCASLQTAPSLLATEMKGECYKFMFQCCTSLTTAPALPATTLDAECYEYMFLGCTSLTTAPALPATTLYWNCYAYMFQNCTSLTTAPQLQATTLSQGCYMEMFRGCTSLTTAPELPAATLVTYCYQYMFSGCTSLSSITCLATDISASNCTRDWVKGVASSGTFTKAASMNSWVQGVTKGIPSNWTVQDYSS